MSRKLKDEDLSEIREAFSLFDKDGNGKITFSELNQVLTSFGQKPSKKYVKNLLKEADKDKDGTISFDEFVHLMERELNTIEKYNSSLKSAFKAFDLNGDGYISPGELKQAMANLDQFLTDDEIADMIYEADRNSDGKINYEEFIEIMNSK